MTLQVTLPLPGSKFVVLVNCAVVPACTVAVPGVTETVIATTVMLVEPDFVESATEVAVMLTFRSLAGGVAGAEYVTATPLADVVGETEPQDEEEQDTAHFTPMLLESFATVAVRFAVTPACTVAMLAETDTLVGGGGAAEPPPQPDTTMERVPTNSKTAPRESRLPGFMTTSCDSIESHWSVLAR